MRRTFPVDLAAVRRIPRAVELAAPIPLRAETRAGRVDLEPVSAKAWRALAIAALGTVLVGFNSTATNIALNDIQRGLGATSIQVGWGVAGYFIGTAAFLPLGGRLADRIGRKRIFQHGLLLFAFSAVLSAVAPTVWTLNGARVVQAIAGAAVLPASLSLVLPLFPESRRTTAVGLWSAAGPLAAGVAPGVSALILAGGGWRAVYFVSAPVAVIMFLVGRRVLIELPPATSKSRLDVVGAAAGTVAIAALVAAIMQGRIWGYASLTTLSVGALGASSLILFIVNSMRHDAPLLSVHLLRRRGVRYANVANFLVSITSLSIWLVWPTWLLEMWDYSTFGVGLGVTVGPLAAWSSTVVFSRIGDRVGRIALCRLGGAIQVAAVSWQLVNLDLEVEYWWAFAPGPILFGIGWGMSAPLLNSIALDSVEEEFFGETNGLFNTLRYAAAAVGTAAMFALLTVKSGSGALEFYQRTLLFFLVATAAGFLALWLPHRDAEPAAEAASR